MSAQHLHRTFASNSNEFLKERLKFSAVMLRGVFTPILSGLFEAQAYRKLPTQKNLNLPFQ